jgi:glycosyltransferase involved in cell wall biosynthesis
MATTVWRPRIASPLDALSPPRGAPMSKPSAIIVVQQESLRERPRVHKLATVLSKLGIGVEIWKFGAAGESSELEFPVRNLIGPGWRHRPPLLRYIAWMSGVLWRALWRRRGASIFAIGFDSAFPLSALPHARRWLVFDNLDNVSLNYRAPRLVASILLRLERWTASRSKLHVVPSKARWTGQESNLRIVANTPSRDAIGAASAIAQQRKYARSLPLTVYVNGWLSPTRGIRTLLSAVHVLRSKPAAIRILVAGRPASPESQELISLDCTEYLGLLTNAEALAVYYRSHLAFTYYDPSIAINRVAESQKWTDCWATGTPFIGNSEIRTLQPFIERGACFSLPYSDVDALARLLADIASNPSRLVEPLRRLQAMHFRFWDDEMEVVARDWLSLSASGPRTV